MDSLRIGAAILAAGASKRLGQPKQLVRFRSKYLLSHIIDEVSQLDIRHRWVILGAHAEEIRQKVDCREVIPLQNDRWEEGMSSSLRLAVSHATQENLDGLLLTLADQPFVDSPLLQKLIVTFQEVPSCMVACEYSGILGVPVLIGRAHFEALSNVSGDVGAKKLIQAFRSQVKSVKFEPGKIDIDQPEDLDLLKSFENENKY